ncbi:NUDIX hydrolase [Actinocrinis puniceicyclus]|uniref:NUDIX hydrolase n=1 Tax=Actinocrinis puniceicyclus TaxID=977794 RepID=A0A8J8BAW5_9ACTN|nr:NUDIX hydrolase [Actinocrinis puniceicyclus]MBS2961506.1 NUDIX hydrolase [Actinocrinis puniceicyclus]
MTIFRWISGARPTDLQVRQVYGFCFDERGRVLLRVDGEDYGLPGGRPERGEDATATLARECMEESQIEIARPLYFGYLRVTDDGGPPYAQLRMAARITAFLPRHPDPDTGRTYRRLLVPLYKAPALLGWGTDGLLQAAGAVHAAELLGINPDAAHDEVWRDEAI